MDTARLNLVYADIRAPFDGRTGTRLVDIGNLVQAAQATPPGQHHPDQADLRQLHRAAGRQRRRAAQPGRRSARRHGLRQQRQAELARGKLTVIDNQIDTATGTLRLKATFENADERLWPGQFVNVRLVIATRIDAVTVPQRAVMQGASGYFGYVVQGRQHGRAAGRSRSAAVQDGIAIIDKRRRTPARRSSSTASTG